MACQLSSEMRVSRNVFASSAGASSICVQLAFHDKTLAFSDRVISMDLISAFHNLTVKQE